MAQVRKPDAALRARAYQELYRTYGNDGPILGQMYQTLVRDWRNEQVDLRNFNNPSQPATWSMTCRMTWWIPCWMWPVRIRRSSSDSLDLKPNASAWTNCAGMISMPRLPNLRRNTRLPKRPKKCWIPSIDFEPRFGSLARQVFTEDHIDSEVRKGKQDGAYCETLSPRITPWVKLELPGWCGRCGHHGTRTRTCHPFTAGKPAQPVHPALLPAAGRNRLDLWRNDAGRPAVGRGNRRRSAARPFIPASG